MQTDPTTAMLDDLRWLRALAGRLTRDPHLADDVVQDACAQVLGQQVPPQQPRAWLVTVVKNLLHGHRRRDAAQKQREAASRPGTAEDGLSLLQRAETQHRLAAAVLQLDEPYRSTVLLRFFDGLPPRRIAQKLGVPVATVHSRLQRALQQLRSQLDRQPGGREQWLMALVPFALPSTFLPSPGLGLLVMQANLKLLAAAALVVCSIPFWWPTAAASDDTSLPDHGKVERAGGSAGGASRGRTPANSASAPERRSALPAPADPRPAAARFPISGRVCDCSGTGVPDLLVAPNDDRELAVRSDAAGNFHFELQGTNASLAACDERYVTVLAASWSKDARIAPVIVVARSLALGGRVVDGNAAPIAGAQLLMQLPADFDSRFPVPLDRAERRRWNATSGPDGAFALARLPLVDGATLFCAADAFAPVTLPMPAADDAGLQIVLQRFRYEAGEMMGLVIDPAGAPVEGARVAMGVTSVVSDREGRFGLSLLRAGWPTPIVAAKAGFRPARCEVPGNGGKRREDWPQELVLRLGPAPQSVRGRVVDQDKKGIAGAEVWIVDPTPFGIAGVLPMQLEYLVAGGEVPKQAARMKVPFADEPTREDNFINQMSNPKEPSACWYFVTTDAEGDFELPGLLDRGYQLRALDPATGLSGDTNSASAFGGGHVEICIVRNEVWPELRGRVVSLAGKPIAGVSVEQTVVAFQNNARVPGGRFEGTALREGRRATTGADGTFVLRDVGKRFSIFSVHGDPIVPTSVQGLAVQDPANFTIVVEARCHCEVVLLDPAEADAVACVDAAGEGIDLAILRNNSNQFETDLTLHQGRSGLFVVGERAAKLLLSKNGKVVREIVITPDPGKTTTVQ